MNVILRSPEMANEKRLLGASRKLVAFNPISSDEFIHDEPGPTNATFSASPDDVEFREQEWQQEKRLDEIEQASKRAYEEAYETGLRNGETEGRQAYTSGLQQLESLTQNLNSMIQQSLDESEDMMVSIVFESVCKIVGDSLATREGVISVVKEALSRVRGKSTVIIRVNPFDLELIEESAAFGVASEADWRGDESIPLGGCMIESEYGTLDARIDTQLNQLKRVLLAARHKPITPDRND